MLRCWAYKTEDRPTFVELKSKFTYDDDNTTNSAPPQALTSRTNETDAVSMHDSDYYSTNFYDCLDDIVEV